MHADPTPIFHRDIRWQNVIQSASTRERWFLIDWDDASTSPTHAAMHLDRNTHSLFVFQDGHGAEVDIWGVGQLVMKFAPDISATFRAVGQRMIAGEIKTAHQALDELVNI
jgi:hypothetical protein